LRGSFASMVNHWMSCGGEILCARGRRKAERIMMMDAYRI
jgi:hypothetical protein